KRTNYPFGDVVPSLATAIGSSGDSPEALAEVMGILVNEGVHRPILRVSELRLAEGTPYEAVLHRLPEPGVQVLSPEVAATARDALVEVVERGTARGIRGVMPVVGGK